MSERHKFFFRGSDRREWYDTMEPIAERGKPNSLAWRMWNFVPIVPRGSFRAEAELQRGTQGVIPGISPFGKAVARYSDDRGVAFARYRATVAFAEREPDRIGVALPEPGAALDQRRDGAARVGPRFDIIAISQKRDARLNLRTIGTWATTGIRGGHRWRSSDAADDERKRHEKSIAAILTRPCRLPARCGPRLTDELEPLLLEAECYDIAFRELRAVFEQQLQFTGGNPLVE